PDAGWDPLPPRLVLGLVELPEHRDGVAPIRVERGAAERALDLLDERAVVLVADDGDPARPTLVLVSAARGSMGRDVHQVVAAEVVERPRADVGAGPVGRGDLGMGAHRGVDRAALDPA